MTDEPKTTTEAVSVTSTTGPVVPLEDSTFMGISVRAWLAVVLVMTVCLSHGSVAIAVLVDAVGTKDWSKVGTYTNIGEPLYSMSVMALGFYFGQKTSKNL